MWKLDSKTINYGRAWTDNSGNQYPANWLNMTTDAEKNAVGLKWIPDSPAFDSRFYYTAGKAKPLDDLKKKWVTATKETANSLLKPYDWYVVRKAEIGTEVPSTVTTYRASVRTSCAKIETAINNASDLDAFIALFEATINDWPEPLE